MGSMEDQCLWTGRPQDEEEVEEEEEEGGEGELPGMRLVGRWWWLQM